MTAATQSARHPHLPHLPRMHQVSEEPMTTRTLPILSPPSMQVSAPSPGDPMEITTPTNGSPPPSTANSNAASADKVDKVDKMDSRSDGRGTSSGPATPSASSNNGPHSTASPADSADPMPKSEGQAHAPGHAPAQSSQPPGAGANGVQPPAPAAAAIHQPKIVQTAFIHKLYNMLEDQNIQHLISWSSSAESFVMSPSHDFSKVLAQYFKHTNISSFVRQLNMYGFHKVSDVFANGADSQTLWEFKHGNGNFKRGDLVGLREIKRRASRHHIGHAQREFNPPKQQPPTQPGTPAEAMPMPDSVETMRAPPTLDQAMYSIETRLQRQEEALHMMHVRHQASMDTIARLLRFNQETTRVIKHLVPNPDSTIYRDVMAMQAEIANQIDASTRIYDDAYDTHGPLGGGRPQYFAHVDGAPVSPRQMAQDDPRRGSLAAPPPPRGNFYRPPVPSNLSASTRRPYGSIGGAPQASPSAMRPHPPPPPPPPQHPQHSHHPQHAPHAPHGHHPQHPLANVDPLSMGRRHTAADIRAHGWQASSAPPLPHAHFPPSGPGAHIPPSPSRLGQESRAGAGPEDQRIRESFSSYSFQQASQPHSRPSTPPPPVPPFSNGSGHGSGHANGGANGSGAGELSSWSWGTANRSTSSLTVKDASGPPTRRSSMAHILNPTDTAERDDEDGSPRDDDRKRKRL